MKKYTVSLVRERFAQALDEAQRGEPVFIERKGVTYRLSVERPTKPTDSRKPYIDVLDPAVDAGQWTWDWSPTQLRFRSKLKKGARRRR
jgi:hypothetical protein